LSNFCAATQADSRLRERDAARPICRPSERDVSWALEFREAVNSPGWMTVREEAGVRILTRSEGRMTLVKVTLAEQAIVKTIATAPNTTQCCVYHF
jgi:hypothetical protein